MCGIAGIIASNKSHVNIQRLEKMTQALAHRGPDGEKHWINPTGNAGFGHSRLAIICLGEEGAQPMHYADRYSIVHNGEIYNYKEIRETLIKKGYSFRTQSDTEVILAAYACYGEDCLQHFDGMFAFAIWDEQEHALFAARDRFGEKPFFYYDDGLQLVFASEMKALWAAGVPKIANERMLYNYITLGYVQNPHNPIETFFSGVYKLPARGFMRYRAPECSITLHSYYDVDTTPNQQSFSDKDITEQFRELFNQSVTRRLRSDVPLGTSLSGGLDSSSMLATMTSISKTSYKSFSAVFPGFAKDESAYVQEIATACKSENFRVQPTADSVLKNFEKICYHQEEPFQSTSVWAQYSVYELARQHQVKVLLDGQGADEVLAGYFKYYHWYWQELFSSDKKMLQQEMAAARNLGVEEKWGWKNKLAATYPSFAAMYLKNQRKAQQKKHKDFTRDFTMNYGHSHYETPHQDTLNGVLYYNTFLNGLEELLRYADRNSMAHGLEVRLPFLQHELVSFIFSLPSNFKIRHGRTKWLLRQCMEGIVPVAILQRTDKIGFEPPQQQWLTDKKLQEYMHESVRGLVERKILRKRVLDKKIQPHDAHAAENYDWRYLLAGRLLL
jgi:asparagine synthase (glutamine-hydrolysing)